MRIDKLSSFDSNELLEDIRKNIQMCQNIHIKASYPIENIQLKQDVIKKCKMIVHDASIILSNVEIVSADMTLTKLKDLDKQRTLLNLIYFLVKSFLIPMCNDPLKSEGIMYSDGKEINKFLIDNSVDVVKKNITTENGENYEISIITPNAINECIMDNHNKLLQLTPKIIDKEQ